MKSSPGYQTLGWGKGNVYRIIDDIENRVIIYSCDDIQYKRPTQAYIEWAGQCYVQRLTTWYTAQRLPQDVLTETQGTVKVTSRLNKGQVEFLKSVMSFSCCFLTYPLICRINVILRISCPGKVLLLGPSRYGKSDQWL